jgi:hypothetical protein
MALNCLVAIPLAFHLPEQLMTDPKLLSPINDNFHSDIVHSEIARKAHSVTGVQNRMGFQEFGADDAHGRSNDDALKK